MSRPSTAISFGQFNQHLRNSWLTTKKLILFCCALTFGFSFFATHLETRLLDPTLSDEQKKGAIAKYGIEFRLSHLEKEVQQPKATFGQQENLPTLPQGTNIARMVPTTEGDDFTPSNSRRIALPKAFIEYEGHNYHAPLFFDIAEVNNAAVIPKFGVVVAEDGNACDFGHWYWKADQDTNDSEISVIEMINTAMDLPIEQDAEYISFLMRFDSVFQHIAFDTLPLLSFACEFTRSKQDAKILVANEIQQRLIQEYCAGLNGERFRYLGNAKIDDPIRAASVFLPYFENENHHAMAMGVSPPGAMFHINQRRGGGEQVVYLARAPGTPRAVENEDLVLDAVREIYPNAIFHLPGKKGNTLTERQVLENAKIIIGPHGGALSNIIYAPKGSTLIEFTNIKTSHDRPCFLGLAKGLGFDYYGLEPTKFSFTEGEMLIDVVELKELLIKIKELS